MERWVALGLCTTFDGLEVESALEAGILEHGHRLAAVIDDDLPALELVPREGRIGSAAGEEKAILLVDLSEVERWRDLALLQRGEALARRRLGHMHRPVQQTGNR